MKRIALCAVALTAAATFAAPASADPPCTHGECIGQVQALLAQLLEKS